MATITIDVDIRDIMDELDTDDLKRELRERGEDDSRISDTERDLVELVEQARHALLRHDPAEALIYIERALYGQQKLNSWPPLLSLTVVRSGGSA